MKGKDEKILISLTCSPKQRSVIAAFRKKYNQQHGTKYTRSEILLLAFSEFAKKSKITLELVQKELFSEK